jgi:hypothetical protein
MQQLILRSCTAVWWVTEPHEKADALVSSHTYSLNGTVHFKKGKQLFEYHHLLLLRDIWWTKF